MEDKSDILLKQFFAEASQQQIADVVRLQMKHVADMLAPQGITLEATPHAIEYLAQEGYDPDFGARPVKRAIQHHVLNQLSKALLSGTIDRSRPIIVDKAPDAEQLSFRN